MVLGRNSTFLTSKRVFQSPSTKLILYQGDFLRAIEDIKGTVLTSPLFCNESSSQTICVDWIFGRDRKNTEASLKGLSWVPNDLSLSIGFTAMFIYTLMAFKFLNLKTQCTGIIPLELSTKIQMYYGVQICYSIKSQAIINSALNILYNTTNLFFSVFSWWLSTELRDNVKNWSY